MRLLRRMLGYLRKERAEDELSREVASHLSMLEDEFVRKGLTPMEARAAANRAFGNLELTKELAREERYFVWLDQAWQDVRYGVRSLRASPVFALTAIVTLALGIGVNLTIFVAYDALVLKPLPVAEPDRVVRWERWFKNGSVGDIQYGFSLPEFQYCQEHTTSFSSVVAASWPVPALAQINGSVKRTEGQLVSNDYFSALGIGLERGRPFLPGDEAVVVISHAFWQNGLGADGNVLGRSIELNRAAFLVIGVARADFGGTSVGAQRIPDFWAPVGMQSRLAPGANWKSDPNVRDLQILGRMSARTGMGRAQAEVDTMVRQFGSSYQERDPTSAVTLQHTAYFGNTEDPRFKLVVAGLMAIVGMVLMVACANIANMLLARGAAREREISVRLALGAGRGRLIRQFLTESFLLSATGGVVGLVLALWTSKLLWASVQPAMGGFSADSGMAPIDFCADTRVVCYTLAISFGTAFLFGIWPALQFTKTDLAAALKGEATMMGRRVKGSRLRSLLVTAQVGISMLLLVSAGLLMRGMVRSQAADPGFEMNHLMVLNAEFGSTPARAMEMERRMVDRLQSEPAVRGAAMGTVPYTGSWTPPIMVGERRGRTAASYASETYFETLGVGITRGRGFTRRETESNAPVAVISEGTGKSFWPGEDPLGKRLELDLRFTGKLTAYTVIGVARDVRFTNLTRVDPSHVYLTPDPARTQGLILRVVDSRSDLRAVSQVVKQVDESMLSDLRVESLKDGPVRLERYKSQTISTFCAVLAGLALVLSAVGIYGVMGFLVNRRVKEIGIRMALGAKPGNVLVAILMQGFRPVIVGLALGIGGAGVVSWALHESLAFPGSSDLLYGIPFYDPVTFVSLSVFLVGVALVASWVPARKALRVDPMVALRYE